MIRAFANQAGAAVVHLHNVSGGLLSGDRLTASLELEAGCQAQITTTGATRIYKAKEKAAPAWQQVEAAIGESALLEYLPDPVIPFGGSRSWQTSLFQLGHAAGLFAWEMIAPGRSGERFAFRDLITQTEIRSGETLIALDLWSAQPQLCPLASVIRLGAYSHQAVFYICRAGIAQTDWLRWEHSLSEWVHSLDTAQQIWGISALPRDGLVCRGLANEGLYLQETLIHLWRRMKRELYGCEPVLPRKTF